MEKKSNQKENNLAKLKAKFEAANFNEKISIFSKANHCVEKGDVKANKQFCTENWHKLIYLINNVENGQKIYQALFNLAPDMQIWATVAALQTIKIWATNNTIEKMTTDFWPLYDLFSVSLNAQQIVFAEKILQNM